MKRVSTIDHTKTIAGLAAAGFGAIAILILASTLKPFVIINAGERGVVMKFGKVQDTILDEGIHGIMPIVTTVKPITVRVQKNNLAAQAASKDLQQVSIDVALNWSVDKERVNEIFQRIGDEEQILNRIINPAVAEVVKATTAQKNAEEIITKRTELKQAIDNQLKERLSPYGVLIEDTSLENVGFSEEFSKAIEAKQIAEQEAKRAQFIALKAEQEAQAEINRAKGQAEAQRLLRQNLTPEILQQQAIEKWNGQFPTVMGGNGSLPLINISPPTQAGR